MKAETQHFSSPEDRLFKDLLQRATQGEIEVYGVVIETSKVEFKRYCGSHRPEATEDGKAVLQSMWNAWQSGKSIQPWLYVCDGAYVVADDYFWLALIEKGEPETIAAQVLGEPLQPGLKQKVGPLPPDRVRAMLGLEGS